MTWDKFLSMDFGWLPPKQSEINFFLLPHEFAQVSAYPLGGLTLLTAVRGLEVGMGSNPAPGTRLVMVGAGASKERALASSGILPAEASSKYYGEQKHHSNFTL